MGVEKPQEMLQEAAMLLAEAEAFYKANRLFAFREPVGSTEFKIVELNPDEKVFMPPNPKQDSLLRAWDNRNYRVFTFTGGNRSGKTTIIVIIALSVMFGEWLWSGMRIWFPHRKPRKVRIVGQGWESHIKAVLIPAIINWFPKVRGLKTKKNNQGVEAIWVDTETGSSLEIMSNSQESDVFEGWEGDLVLYDEPPRREVRIACARGLIDRSGRELFGATLLKEAWIHREIIKARTPAGKPDTSVFNVHSEIYDNVGYGLRQEDVDQFKKTLKPEEVQARIHGKPSYMSTLVYPRFDRDKHVKEPFTIPLDWLVDVSIDFHPSKKWAVVFMATARNNIKYVCDEMHEHGNPKHIAEEIVRRARRGDYRLHRIIIDPLAKGGEKNFDATVYDIVAETLAARGFTLETASKEKDIGIAMVNNLLWTENQLPGLYFFDSCVNTIKQVEDLMYDPETLKPTALKVDDDFTECLYRLALLDTQWWAERTLNIENQRSMML